MEEMQPNPELDSRPTFAKNIQNPFILAALKGDNTGLVFKYIGGAMLIFGIFVIGQFASGLLFLLADSLNGSTAAGDVGNTKTVSGVSIDKNLFLVIAITSFMIGILGIWIVIRYIHNRKFLSLITPHKKVNWKKIVLAFVIYFLLSGLVEYYFYLSTPENYEMHFNLPRFLVLLAIVLFLMPFQTSFEELFFRGYLLQGSGLLFRRTLPAVILTAILFALMHGGNPEIAKFGFWTMFPFYFSFGLMLGFITVVDKGLEIPLAVHAANNMFGSLFITFEGSALETDALFYQKEMDPVAAMPYYLGSMLVFLLISAFIFGWWKKKPNTTEDNFV